MRCFVHHDLEAVGLCKTCGKGLCPDCARQESGWLHCGDECAKFSSEVRASVLRMKEFPRRRRKALVGVAGVSLGIGLLLLVGALLAGDGADSMSTGAFGIVFVFLSIVAMVVRRRIPVPPA